MSSEEAELVECPALECDYSSTLPAVKGHWGGSQDEDHQGAFHQALEAYEDAHSDGTTPEASASGGSVEPPGAEEPPEPDVSKCPECGETDWFDPHDYGYEGDRDRGCPSCSTEEEWVLYDV